MKVQIYVEQVQTKQAQAADPFFGWGPWLDHTLEQDSQGGRRLFWKILVLWNLKYPRGRVLLIHPVNFHFALIQYFGRNKWFTLTM